MIISFLSCTKNKDSEKKQEAQPEEKVNSTVSLTDAQFKTLGISLAKGELRKIKPTLQLNGALNVPPQYTVSINAPFGGFVKNLQVQEGSPVRQGQLLAFIQNPEYISLQQEYLENLSQLPYLESEYSRQSELAKEQINAQKAVQKAKSELELAKAKRAGQKAKLELLGIDIKKLEAGEISPGVALNSPINGFVTAVKTNLGAYISNTDVIFEMMDVEHLYAELAVYEKDISKLQINQKVNLTFVGENQPRQGTIRIIGRKVNEDRTAHVYCGFNVPDSRLRPGMFLKASVEISEFETLAVPEKAIVNHNGNDYVFVQKSDKNFELTAVKTGISYDGFVEIISGLSAGMEVVEHGAFQLLAVLKNIGE